jgi:alpha-mannosidase
MNTTLIANSLKQLRQFVQIEAMENWRGYDGDLPIAAAIAPETWQTWQPLELNGKRHISWLSGRRVLWLGQYFQIPPHVCGYDWSKLTVRLALHWWAEAAQIFVNGTLVQEGDLFDCWTRVCLSPRGQVGESFAIALRLVSPEHDHGALVRSMFLQVLWLTSWKFYRCLYWKKIVIELLV